MEGRGEILSPVARLPSLPMLLVNPGVAVPTRDVFTALAAPTLTAPAQPDDFIAINAEAASLVSVLAARRNDLEIPAIKLQPVVADVLHTLQTSPDCLLARMSGSGATCFALFGSVAAAKDVAQRMQAHHPGWWVRAASLR
jgi:4-diphosphocytidyl-2-C-methyl-D-erythritol kinase